MTILFMNRIYAKNGWIGPVAVADWYGGIKPNWMIRISFDLLNYYRVKPRNVSLI